MFLFIYFYNNVFVLLIQYSKFVKPAFDDFILPTKKYADIIIPRGGDNHVAIDLIVQHIRTKLGQHDLCKIYPNLYVIQSTFQVYKLSAVCFAIFLKNAQRYLNIYFLHFWLSFLLGINTGSFFLSSRYEACIH